MDNRRRQAGRLPAAWALTILLPPAAWTLACGLHNCPFFFLELGGLLQPILGLIWLEALLAVSSEWLRGRPALAFALGSAASYSVLVSPTSAAFLHKALAYGSRWPYGYLIGLFLPPAILSTSWGLGAAVASGLLGERRRESGYVLTALLALAGGLFIFLITPT